METYFKTKSIFSLLLKWKWHLIVLVVVAGALGSLFSSSWFIKPKFKSSATVYPANIVVFSDESETEQMLELIQSTDIKFKVIESFELFDHYEISKDDNNYIAKVIKAFDGNVSFQKTPNEAIVITAVDEDPEIASDMVDSIISFYNLMVLELNIKKSQEIVKIYGREVTKKSHEVDSLGDVLKTLRTEYGLLDMSTQVEKYTEAIYMGKSLDEARDVLGNWKEFGAEYHKVDSLFFYAISDLHVNKTIYEKATRDAHKVQTYAHVISKPFPADKKTSPVRWLIVLFSVIGAFLAGTIVIALIEGAKKQ